jgi:hypothetical protein
MVLTSVFFWFPFFRFAFCSLRFYMDEIGRTDRTDGTEQTDQIDQINQKPFLHFSLCPMRYGLCQSYDNQID